MRACVNSGVDIIVLQFLTVVTADSIEANGGFWDEMGPLTDLKTGVQGQAAADWQLIGLLLFNALNLSMSSNFKVVPSVCTYLCLPVSE